MLVVHRPRYDDWSWPKGKLGPGEGHEAGARREVEEETGLVCELGPELATERYVDGRGRPKEVRYWAMTPTGTTPAGGEFQPNAEVDEIRWLTVAEALALLTYDRDRTVLAALPV